MKCDELRGVVESGGELRGEAWEHAGACPRCREEFAHLRALRASMPELPSGLRDRVVEAAFPARRGGFRWQVAAAAAAVALAFVGGISLGRDVERKNVASVEPKIVVKEMAIAEKPDDKDLFLLALALERVYKTQVQIEYDGIAVKHIHANVSVRKAVPFCPVAQKLVVAANERPDKVDFDK